MVRRISHRCGPPALADRRVAVVSRSFAFCLPLYHGVYALKKRSSRVKCDGLCLEKNTRKPPFFRSFLFTPGCAIPYHSNVPERAEARKRRTTGRIRLSQGERMAKLTQSQFIKELAAATNVPNKAAKEMATAYADLAIKETKKNGVAILPGIGRLVRVD